MTELPGPMVIRRYRSSIDGSWLKRLPQAADPQGDVEGDCLTWVATLDGKLAGVATWRVDEPRSADCAALTRFWIEPSARRLGIGTRLYFRLSSEIRKTFKKQGGRIVRHSATCDRADEAATPFLLSLKFDVKVDPPERKFEPK